MTDEKWHDINHPESLLPYQLEALRQKALREKKKDFQNYNAVCEAEAKLARDKLKPAITEPKWSHTDPARAQESPDSVIVGDKIILEFKITDIIQGANINFYIKDTASETPWRTERKVSGNVGKNGLSQVEWVVDKCEFDAPNPQFQYWAEDPDCNKPAKSAMAPAIPCKPKPVWDFIEIPDTLFVQNSAMPLFDENGLLIGALCAVFVHIKKHEGTQALVCGHADKTDEDALASAFEISSLRATAIKALLTGDEDTWLDSTFDFSKPSDIQRFLSTMESSYGWDCDPGKIDGVIGPKVKAAIKKYKTEFNKRLKGTLKDTDQIDCEMAGSFFKVIRSKVEEEFKKSSGENALPTISWGSEKGFYAGGTSFLPENRKSKTGRRVEILLFSREIKPVITEHTDSKTPVKTSEISLYGNGFDQKPLEFKNAASTTLKIKEIFGPAHLAHNEKETYSVKSFNIEASEAEKKSICWVVRRDGKEVEKHEKTGDKFEFSAIGEYAGDTITVHPYLRSPSDKLCVKTTVGECLLYDGKNLQWIDESLKSKKTWEAVSGTSGHSDPAKEGGPIPAGKWVALQSRREHTPGGSWWEKLTNASDLKEYGTDRIGLYPFKGTETHGRKDFYIHGGAEAGSGHGVDLTDNMKEFLEEFVKNGKDLVLVVIGAKPSTIGANKTSDNGINLIMKFEGFRAHPYNDAVGHATIGYGTLLHKGNVTEDDKKKYPNGISKEKAKELLVEEVRKLEPRLIAAVKVPLNQNQFDALISWTYNLGSGNLVENRCSWLKNLNQKAYDKVPDGLLLWNKAKNEQGVMIELPGLTSRRKEEGNLFKQKS